MVGGDVGLEDGGVLVAVGGRPVGVAVGVRVGVAVGVGGDSV